MFLEYCSLLIVGLRLPPLIAGINKILIALFGREVILTVARNPLHCGEVGIAPPSLHALYNLRLRAEVVVSLTLVALSIV